MTPFSEPEVPVPDDRIYLNGVNALTGEYLAPPLSPADAVRLARSAAPPEGKAGWFRSILRRLSGGRLYGLPSDVDPREVTQAGWAVVFPSGRASGILRLTELGGALVRFDVIAGRVRSDAGAVGEVHLLLRRAGADPADDFDHPLLPDSHPLQRHVLYRLLRKR